MLLSEATHPHHDTGTSDGSCRAMLITICTVIGCVLFSPAALARQTGPTSVPTTGQTVDLDANQLAVLAGVRDNTHMIDEAGLYILLGNAKRLDAARLRADAVPARREDLLAHPEWYRGRLVDVPAYYAETQTFRPTNRRRYPDPAYSTLAWDRGNLEPVSLVTVDAPGTIARKAHVRLIGYFLKLRRDERRGPDPKTGATSIVVPVLVGRAVTVEQRSIWRPDTIGVASVALPVGLAALAVFWFALRYRIKRQRRDDRRGARRSELPETSADPNAPENQPIDLNALSAGAVASGRCGRCGGAVGVSARFCEQCGASLHDERRAAGEDGFDENSGRTTG